MSLLFRQTPNQYHVHCGTDKKKKIVRVQFYIHGFHLIYYLLHSTVMYCNPLRRAQSKIKFPWPRMCPSMKILVSINVMFIVT